MFCKYCGKEISNDTKFCPNCGNPSSDINMKYNELSHDKKGLSIASLVLGILGFIVWLLPIVGFPVIIVGLILGIIGHNKGGKGFSTAGIILCIITLILTTANSAFGACKGYHGLLFFQESQSENNIKTQKSQNEFTIRDDKGNILMNGGISSATTSIVTDDSGNKNYVIEISFTDDATEKFATVTSEHIGECISIYLNDDMLANPRVMYTITEGKCQISGEFSHQEALDLVEKLNSTVN